jgi:hypothetical protein
LHIFIFYCKSSTFGNINRKEITETEATFFISHLKAKLGNGSVVESKKMKKIFVTSLILCLGVFKLVVQCEIWTDKIIDRKYSDSIPRSSKGFSMHDVTLLVGQRNIPPPTQKKSHFTLKIRPSSFDRMR